MKIINKLIVITFITYSCTNSNNNTLNQFSDVDGEKLTKNIKEAAVGNSDIIQIDIKHNDEELLFLSSICDSIWGIKLETTDASMIGSIDKMKITDSCIYVLDKRKSRALVKFDRNGKYLTKFGKPGRGPEEYHEPTDFYLFSDVVVIYDQFSSKLNFYNAGGGFIKTQRVPFILTSLHYINKNELICHSFSTDNFHVEKIMNYSLFWCDSLFNINYVGAYRNNDIVNSFLSKNNLDAFGNSIIYHEPYSDTIFNLGSSGAIEAKYVINFPEKLKIPQDIFDQNDRDALLKASKTSYAIFFGGQVVPDDYLYFYYSVNNLNHHVFYSHVTGNIIAGSRVVSDLNPVFFLTNILQSENNVLIGYMDAFQIVNNIESAKDRGVYDQIDDKGKLWLSDINPSDNPILMFYKLKNF